MSSIIAQTLDPPATLTGPSNLEIAARHASRRRQRIVVAARIAILVVVLGGWELGTRVGAIDPFFFASPSGIAEQIWTWIAEGTSQGPLWEQVLVTMEETVLGFVIGAVGGVVCGIVLGRNRMLADIFSTYIKVANSIPAWCWARSSSSRSASAWRPRSRSPS